MITDTKRLRREIALEKAALSENLETLEDKARELTDWRRQVRKRPLEAVGVALASGVVLAVIAGRRRPGARRRPDTGEDGGPGSLLAHPIVDRLVAALAVVAAEKALELLGEIMPGRPRASDDAPLAPRRGA